MIIEISKGVTVNLEQIGAVIKAKDESSIIIIGGKEIPSKIKYDRLIEFMKNANKVRTSLAYWSKP